LKEKEKEHLSKLLHQLETVTTCCFPCIFPLHFPLFVVVVKLGFASLNCNWVIHSPLLLSDVLAYLQETTELKAKMQTQQARKEQLLGQVIHLQSELEKVQLLRFFVLVISVPRDFISMSRGSVITNESSVVCSSVGWRCPFSAGNFFALSLSFADFMCSQVVELSKHWDSAQAKALITSLSRR
jgi:hypothetical protein